MITAARKLCLPGFAAERCRQYLLLEFARALQQLEFAMKGNVRVAIQLSP